MHSAQLEDFLLAAPIGVGTVGTIYAASYRHPPPGSPATPLAIKILHDRLAEDPLIRARFKREIMLLSRMQHPNIIASFAGGESDGKLFCVMERVDGGAVADLLKHRGTLPWPAVLSVLCQTSSALQCAHNHGVVHRDLKPSNLFLTLDGQVKLGDFGIARDLRSADISSLGMTVGTHAYMAPEQIRGDRSLSGKADLYSLGCCAFEMLTGRPPFVGDNYVQLFEQHLRSEPPRVRNSVPDGPPELEQIILQMLQKQPQQRPFNARAIQGVMLKIMRDNKRVASEQLAQVQLAECIQGRLGIVARREVSWERLAILITLVAAAVVVASLVGR